MKRSRSMIVAGIAMMCLVMQSVIAQDMNPAAPVVFVSAAQLTVAPMLPTPPAKGSAETKAELAQLHRIQNSRTQAQVLQAQKDDAEEDIFIFKDVLGPKFTRETLPLTALLSDHVHSNESVIVNPAKLTFQRPRVYFFDTTISPVCKVTTNREDYAYPSGHATTGYLEALVTAMIVPEKRDAILSRADGYAHNRLVCGVHYPTDIVASKFVAYAMIGLMSNNPQFKSELEAAKTEARVARGYKR